MHPEVAALIDFGRSLSALAYAASLARAREIRHSFEPALAGVDVLLAPATPYPAPPAGETHVEVAGGSSVSTTAVPPVSPCRPTWLAAGHRLAPAGQPG